MESSAHFSKSVNAQFSKSVAQTTTTGRITDLASYSDFGVPKFASAGFASTTGFTGELSDATTGTNAYFSRTYDPMAATWLSPDSYRGTLTNPQTQHRYGYVGGNPATFTDAFGFKISDPGAYAVTAATKTKGGHPAAAVPTGSGGGCAVGACGSSTIPARHRGSPSLSGPSIASGPSSAPVGKGLDFWQSLALNLQLQALGGALGACALVLGLCLAGLSGPLQTLLIAKRDALTQDSQSRSTAGVAGLWIAGTQPHSTTAYGFNSALVQGLQQQSETERARQQILEGMSSWDASYSSHESLGDLGNNLMRDMCTYAAWETSCLGLGNQTKAALGSYVLNATAVHDEYSGDLIGIHFEGSNTHTLGSALGFPPVSSLIDAWNTVAEKSGIGQPVRETFSWTEPIQ